MLVQDDSDTLQRQLPPEEDELAHAISLSLKTAEHEREIAEDQKHLDDDYLASLLADGEKETSAFNGPETSYLKEGESQKKTIDGELRSVAIEFWHCRVFGLVFISF
ncbi:hypothetical protein GH714_019731 [Hevea brasiliensis]|uniref:Uncharacterized protein n=1 Tax=Hevea brasiliensis TaxID=3981 RepID=A0A6A6MD27_HEVBR|nr:hypothetical protein GH714_019731 [Hevea brasiliensis]